MLYRFISVFLLMLLSRSLAFQPDSLTIASKETDKIPGSLIIRTRPSEARVFINKSFSGVTPLRLTLPAGKYSLSLQKEGFESPVHLIEVFESQTRSIDDSLYSVPRFKITTIPANAVIYIDSSFAGRSPLNDFQISPGRHHLKVCLDGFEDLSMDIVLRPGENSFLNLALRPKIGFLTMNVSPSDAEILIDSIKISPERVSKLKLPVGQHDVLVFHPAIHKSIQERIYIGPGVESEVQAPLDNFSTKAALRSAILPGLGQIMEGSYLKGSLEFLSFAAMGYLSFLEYDRRHQKETELSLAKLDYAIAFNEKDAFTAREKLTRASSEMTSAKNRFTVSVAALGAVYGLTILDALIFHSKERSFYIKRTILPLQKLENYGSLEHFELGVHLGF